MKGGIIIQPNANAEKATSSVINTILVLGAMWGIFEATVGYLLHLLPVSTGWIVWYPVACFFMADTYLKAHKASAILCVAFLSAGIKLFNLFFQIRIDKVLNPSVSIIFEAISMFCVVYLLQKLPEKLRKKPFTKAFTVIGMNTGWRILYILYILFLVPKWIRDISVISSSQQLTRFILIDNLATSAAIFLAYWAVTPVLRYVNRIGKICKNVLRPVSEILSVNKVKIAAVSLLICTDIALQMLL